MSERFRVRADCPRGMTDVGYSADAFKEGEIVYRWTGPTWGCISTGIPVTRAPGEYPFYEIPALLIEAVAASDGKVE